MALTAESLGFFGDLAEGVRIEVRRRGASDGESFWALAASLAAGGGALSDLDGEWFEGAGRSYNAERSLLLRYRPQGWVEHPYSRGPQVH